MHGTKSKIPSKKSRQGSVARRDLIPALKGLYGDSFAVGFVSILLYQPPLILFCTAFHLTRS
jgi:hypothetical protein